MKRFWDARADEDAFYFIDNRLAYGHPDLERFWASGPKDLQTVLDSVGARIDAADTVAEIGCGVGRLTRPIAARARRVHAFDVSARMIELAREHNPQLDNVEWIVGDGTSLLPLADASVDACFSHVVFQHIPDPGVTLGYVREMGRVLRPGGWSAFQISNAPEIHRRRGIVERSRAAVRSALGSGPRGQAHEAWLGAPVELGALEAAARDAALELESVVGEGTQYCYVLLRRTGRRDADS